MGDAEALLGHGEENGRGRSSSGRHYVDGTRKGEDGFVFGGVDHGVEDDWCGAEVGYTMVGYGFVNCLGCNLHLREIRYSKFISKTKLENEMPLKV